MKYPTLFVFSIFLLFQTVGWPQETPPPGQRMLDSYFAQRTAELRANCLAPYRTLEAWEKARPSLQRQLKEMLGLDPMPERSPLQPVITGHIDQQDIRVEKLHFQSLPGLYVTANLYLPQKVEDPLPTILYVCGHAIAKEGNRSYGNKVAYQHHGIWFAQHGYACLIIDTIHRGEIEGIHHGTYQQGMWWWNSRGYTSAGIETWNSIRALDYLATRPEVDMDRIGITGRSGGGVYSWWTAAIDERIKVAVPVAGITDLQNQVVDGIVEGHCDCMFMVNTYRWDYAQIAALLAPRPLLIANTDKDTIFPLDGVVRLHSQVRDIYKLHDAEDRLGLLITEGPHKDTQDLRVPTFRWFNRFLKSDDAPISQAAEKRFSNQALAAFSTFPSDAINTQIQETFVPKAPEAIIPEDEKNWQAMKQEWLQRLREKTFRSWPAIERPPTARNDLNQKISGGILQHFTVNVQTRVHLPLYLYIPDSAVIVESLELTILDEKTGLPFHASFQAALRGTLPSSFPSDPKPNTAYAWFAPRGIGPTSWDQGERHHVHVRRRFMLLGETLDSMRVYDIIRSTQTIGSLPSFNKARIQLKASKSMAVNALYASLFHPSLHALNLTDLPPSHREGPDYLNVTKLWDLPQALAVSLEKHPIHLARPGNGLVDYARSVQSKMRWPFELSIE
jgi:hypothetical protein